jgi:PAS domain S-box-containing protein
MTHRRLWWLRYGVAPLAVAAALLLRWLLWDYLGGELAFMLLWPVVVFSAAYGGLGPGLLSTVLCALAAICFLLEPRFTFISSRPGDLLGLSFFIVMGAVISLLMETLHRFRWQTIEEQQRLRVTLASIGDGVIATDTDGRITFVNSVAAALTGWPEVEAIGQTLESVFRIINEQTRQPLANPAVKVLETGFVGGLANHTLLITRDGREIPIDDSAAPIRGPSGDLVGVVLIFRDITRQRLAEKTLREADRRKDEFLAVLGHEIRNYLGPLANCVYLLQKQRATAEVWESMARQIKQLTALVDDLLDVTRISQGKISLHEERIDVAQLVRQTADANRPLFETRRQQLTVTVPPVPVYVSADPMRLSQVLGNLLNNSTKYTPEEGHAWITVESQGPEAVIQVGDNGIGIEPSMLPRVFELFAQAHSAGSGLGIGLALVRRLVEMHNGSVMAQSEGPGRGAVFTVRLPLASPGTTAAGSQLEEQEPESATGATLTRRVLVVEDNPDAARSLALLLRMWGHEARVALDGPSALALAEEFKPEVCLLDLGLGTVSGYEVAGELRRIAGMEQLVLVAMTGYGQEDDRKRTAAAGFDLHLVKPFDVDQLRQWLARLAHRPAV